MRRTLATLLFITVLALGSSALAEVTVELKDIVSLDSDYVRLSDIATISGDEDSAKRIGKVFLGPVPESGESRRISRAQIALRLEQIGLAGSAIITGSDIVLVRRGCLEKEKSEDKFEHKAEKAESRDNRKSAPSLTEEQQRENLELYIERAVKKYIAARFNREDITVRTKIHEIKEEVTPGAKNLKVVELMNGRLPGRATIIVQYEDKYGDCNEFMVTVNSTVHADVLVLRRNVNRNDMVGPDDVSIERRRLVDGSIYMEADRKQLAGMRAINVLRAGTALRVGDVQTPPLVKKNQTLRVTAKVGAFSVKYLAVALSDGRKGDRIQAVRIIRDNSQRTYPHTVIITGYGSAEMYRPEGEK